MRETTAAQCPIHPMETQPCPACLDALDNSMASYNTGYAAGYRAAQAEAGIKPGPLDHQSAATSASSGATAAPSEATASVTDPAADPIADLCARLRGNAETAENEGWPKRGRIFDEAADALERLARERDDVCNVLTALLAGRQDFMRRIEGLLDRAERAEAERDAAQRESEEQARLLGMSGSREAALLAERDALRECVRAADGLRAECDQVPPMVQQRNVLHAYDAARAKVKP